MNEENLNNNQSMGNNKGDKKLSLLIILLLILSGYVMYDLGSIIYRNVIKKDNIQEEVKVLDVAQYTDDYYRMFKVTLPMITSSKANAMKLNKKILDEVLPRTYGPVVAYALDEDLEEYERNASKGWITDYAYVIKNDVIAIYVKASVPEGGKAIAASGDGLYQYNYFYDISNDKILTIGEAAKLMEIKDLDTATSYKELDNESSCSYMIIENGKTTITTDEENCI